MVGYKRGIMKIRKVNVYTLRKLLLIVFNFRTENSNDTQQDLYQQQVQQTRGQSQYSNNKPVKDNPFANANGPIELNDDDLPF